MTVDGGLVTKEPQSGNSNTEENKRKALEALDARGSRHDAAPAADVLYDGSAMSAGITTTAGAAAMSWRGTRMLEHRGKQRCSAAARRSELTAR
jgi:hypothetical protein